jgi:polyisoprenoid-binding protein YceI
MEEIGLSGTWNVDHVHSSICFAVQHMSFVTFKGRFREISGQFVIDEAEPERSSVELTVAAASIDVISERFVERLSAADWFDIENHPQITFRSTQVTRPAADGWQVRGDLRLRVITRELTLDVRYRGCGTHPMSGRIISGFETEAVIDRRDFGITFNVLLDTGAQYIGEKVTLSIEIEGIRQEPAAPA